MGKSNTIRTSLVLSLGGFVNGYDNGIMLWVLGSPSYGGFFHGSYPSRHCRTAAYILSALATFWLADVIGRKRSVFAGACISAVGSTIQAASTSTFHYAIGYMVSSFANGILLMSTQVYIAEIAEVRYRGALIGLVGVLFWWGYFVAQWTGFTCMQLNSNVEWRIPLAIQIIPNLVLAAGVWDFEESPVWLMLRDRKDEAREVLEHLRGDSITSAEDISGEYEEMYDAIAPKRSTGSLKCLYQNPAWRKKLFLACGMQILNQVSGERILTIYTLVLAQLQFGQPNYVRHARLALGMAFSTALIYSTIEVYILHKIGRVKVLVLSALACGISLFANGALSQYFVGVNQGKLRYNIDGEHQLNENALRAMIATNVILYFFFVVYHKTSGVYLPEILPVAIRVRAFAIAAVSRTLMWILDFEMTAHLSLAVYPTIGFKILYGFAVLNLAAAGCYFLFFPETKGKTLSQMEQLFESRVALSGSEDSDAKAPLLSAIEEKSGLATDD